MTFFPLVACAANTDTSVPAPAAGPTSSHDRQSASQYVVIDRSEPAYIVFTGIPKSLDETKLDEIKQQVSSDETLTMLPWQEFLLHLNEYARSVMLRNDYADIKVVDGIVCLVASKQGTGAPWGLTWNGGIALTFNDYQHASRSYETYRKDPSAYKAITDPRRDPVHPSGHLSVAGCD